MSWDNDTAQTRIRLCTGKSTDSHSREETLDVVHRAQIWRGVFRRPRRRA